MNIELLENEIRKHNRLYWEENSPEISDVEYDKLIEQLKELDPNNSLVKSVESSKIIGDKVIHKKPMLSLDKVYKTEDLFKWVKNKSRTPEEVFYIQPKFDGISAKLENGILSTRGNGIEGQNITSRLPLIDIELDGDLEGNMPETLLGEIVIRDSKFKDFGKYKTKSGNLFKNSRNAVAGIMGCDDVAFYSSQGLKVTLVDYNKFTMICFCKNFAKHWNSIFEHFQKMDYPMDGLVVKLADEEYAESLGCTEHHPKSQIAFKFSNQVRESTIIDVEISQGKENLSAIAIVEPVDFDGVTVQRVKIPVTKPVDRDLPCIVEGGIAIGDKISIERSGDVIPTAVRIVPGERVRKIVELNKCPFCGSELEILPTAVRCANAFCFEKKVNKVMFSLETLGVLGIGKVILRKIMNFTMIRDFGDLFDLSLENLELTGIGSGNARNLYAEFCRCKKENKAELVLAALNVPSLGISAAKLLLKNFSIEKILTDLDYYDLINIKGLGEITSREIAEGIEDRRERLKDLVAMITIKQEEVAGESKGTICFTGKVSKPRSEMETIARSKGFTPVDSVLKNLTYLVCGEKAGSKLDKAKKLGVSVISEEDFMNL